MYHETRPGPLAPPANFPKRPVRGALGPVVVLLLLLSGCAGGHVSQGVKYSGKNTNYYTPLPIPVHEAKLMGMLETISTLLGTVYTYGGASATGFDCSGFVQYVYRSAFGVSLPRTSRELSNWGRRVSRSGLRRGDLVFFRIDGSRIDHVGIYIDNDLFVHASSSRGVTMSNLNNSYYKRHFARATRLLEVRDRAR